MPNGFCYIIIKTQRGINMEMKEFFNKLWLKTKAVSKKAWTAVKAHKAISIASAATLVVGTTCAIVLPIALHNHKYASEWTNDAESHWHVATCKHEDEKGDLAAHTYANACDTTCDVCGATRTVGAHSYTNDCDTTCDSCGATRTVSANAHKYTNACDTTCNVCNATRTVGDHIYTNGCDKTCNICNATRKVGAHVYDNACDTTCSVCNATRSIPHTYTNACDATCNVCEAERTPAAHVYTNACDANCDVCDAERTPAAHVYDNACDTTCNVCNETRTAEPHDFDSNTWKSDATSHWHECTVCGAKDTVVAHTYDQKLATDAYLKAEATGSSKAQYYMSCVCGAKGNEYFETDKKSTSLTVSVSSRNKTYDGIAVELTYEAIGGDIVSIRWKRTDVTESSWNYSAPDGNGKYFITAEAGEYTVEVTVLENDLFAGATKTVNFTIDKEITNITEIDIADTVTYTGNPVEISGFTSNNKIGATVEYFDAEGNLVAAPTNAGVYTVKVTVPGDNNWTADVMEKEFTITKAKVDVTFETADSVYGSALNVNVDAAIDLVVEYSSNGTDYDTTVPTAAGSYTVRIYPVNTNYEINGVTEKSFVITKVDVVIDDITIHSAITYSGVAVSASGITANYSEGVEIMYKPFGADDSEYTTTAPVNAGKYVVYAKVPATDNWNEGAYTKEFEIKKLDIDFTLDVSDIVYGDTVFVTNRQDVTITFSTDGVEYTSTVPVKAGTYYVKVTLNDSANYQFVGGTSELVDTFVIEKQTVSNIVVSNITYGDTLNITNRTDVTVTYSTDGVIYNDIVPVDAGTYSIKITLNDAENYKFADGSGVQIAPLTIEKKTVDDVTVSDITFGSTLFITDRTDVTVTYSTDGEIYNDVVPVNAGTYSVKITLNDQDNYKFSDGSGVQILPLTIKKFEINSLELEVVYNATTSYSVDLSDTYADLCITVTVYDENVGTKTVTAIELTGANKDNYSVEISAVSFTIEKATITVIWTDPVYLPYDNTAKVASAAIGGGVIEGDVVTLSYGLREGFDNNVGKPHEETTFWYDATLSGADAENYVMDVPSKSYTIGKCGHKINNGTVGAFDDYGFCTIPGCGKYAGTDNKFREEVTVTVNAGEILYCRFGPANEENWTWDIYYDIHFNPQSDVQSLNELNYKAYVKEGDSFVEFSLDEGLEHVEQGTYIYFVITVDETTSIIFSLDENF